MIRLPHATIILYALTVKDHILAPVQRASPQMEKLAMVCIKIIEDKFNIMSCYLRYFITLTETNLGVSKAFFYS